jgi:hypothetical protein
LCPRPEKRSFRLSACLLAYIDVRARFHRTSRLERSTCCYSSHGIKPQYMKIDTSCKERKCHAIAQMCDHLLWRLCWRLTLYLPIHLTQATRPDRGQGHGGFCIRRVLTHTWTFQTRSEHLAESFRRPRSKRMLFFGPMRPFR